MEKKTLYLKKYMVENDGLDRMLMTQTEAPGNALSSKLSEEAAAGLLRFLESQNTDEPLDEELSSEGRQFMLKCIYISEFNYYNLEVTQTPRELIADFNADYANFKDFEEVYHLADKIELSAKNDMFMSIKFIYKLHK